MQKGCEGREKGGRSAEPKSERNFPISDCAAPRDLRGFRLRGVGKEWGTRKGLSGVRVEGPRRGIFLLFGRVVNEQKAWIAPRRPVWGEKTPAKGKGPENIEC